MRNLNVYQGGAEYAQDNQRSYPAVSLIYDGAKPPIAQIFRKGVFIETVNGDLVRKEDWDGDTMVANCIYVSDGQHRVRLALEWCNENNCAAVLATDNGDQDGDTYMDDGKGEPYGEDWCRAYRWTSGYDDYYSWQGFIEGISIYNSYDWEGKKNTQIIKENFDIKNFPAFHACVSYHSPKGEEGYLMGNCEWQLAFKYADEIAAIDEMLGYTNPNMFGEVDCHWSSSLSDEYNAWLLSTGESGSLTYYSRYDYCCVRPAF